MFSRSHDRRSVGFTLIEVLLAVTILGIVLVAVNTVFYGALKLRNRTADALEAALPVQHALAVLRRDLRGVQYPGGTLVASFKVGTVGTGVTVQQGLGLEFFTSTGSINDEEPWGDIQKVTYQLLDSTERGSVGTRDLVRIVSRNLLPTTTDDLDEQRLLSRVNRFEVAVYDGTDWRDTWDTTQGDTGLPMAVRVRLLLAGESVGADRGRQPLELMVPLVCQSRTNQTQTSSASGGQP